MSIYKSKLIHELRQINKWIRLYMQHREYYAADKLRTNRDRLLNKAIGA